MIKMIVALCFLISGCTTTTLLPEIRMPQVPEILMVPPENLNTLTDGSIQANDALSGIVQNYSICRQNAEQLTSLQAIIREYDRVIKDYNQSIKKK